jgi:hypothetical protein
VLGKSIVPRSLRARVPGKSIVPVSAHGGLLGKSIVPRRGNVGVLGKSIGRNDRLADGNDRLAELLSEILGTNDRLADGNDRLAGPISPRSRARSTERGTPRDCERPRSLRSCALSL